MLMAKKYTRRVPELWGGIECSYNRVRGKYFDQLQYCDHYGRAVNDITLFQDLGITTMRYPVIWERLQTHLDQVIDWSSAETPLNELREKGIKPIAGLVHHGSGPRFADIASNRFASGLSSFAAKVAEKFPWIEYYTPVNEPLTTARFCALYGVWYPHKRNDKTFVRTLLNELKGIVLSMREIKKINPDAKLVQTEDLAKIYSTPFMKYQAIFENHRRWLTFDILCGMLKPGHALWSYFKKYASSESDLYFFVENPCIPDIIGLDYYPTSERYLDENLDKYPIEKHGHNHRHRYADAEAIRVRHRDPSGPAVLLKEVWDRYQIPMAITEVHINCDYDNQIRWFGEIRNVCIGLIEQGIDIRAVTTWAMLGSYGWNRLLTLPYGDYESGAFDVSTGTRIATPVAEFVKKLSSDPEYFHPAMEQKGWWHDEERYLFEHYTPADLTARDHPILKEDCVEK
jgi:dTDP-4-dehydrorhamnose reductase